MKIKSLNLKNYRQYKNVEIIFADSNKKAMITVIEGANGAGKTNLLNAITWCLYGQEMHISLKDKGLPILNNITLSELDTGKSATVEVSLVVQDNQGGIESINRSLDIVKTKEGLKEYPSILKAAFKSPGEIDWSISKEPALRAEKVLPRNIQEYFFFDGERLDKYFIQGPKREIKKEVFQVSQLNYFNQVIEHLEKMGSDYAKETSHLNPKIEDINEKIRSKKMLLDSTLKAIEELQTKADEARQEEENLLEEVKKLPISGDKVKELRSKSNSIEKRMESIEQEIKDLKEDRTNNLIEYSKIIFAYEHLKETKTMLEKKVEKGEIPPEFKTVFIEKLLEKGECICGTEIKEGAKRERVKALLKECSELDEISHELIKEQHNLSILINKAKQFKPNLLKIGKSIESKGKDYELLSNQLKEINDQIAGIDDDKVQKIESRYRIVRNQRESIIDKLGEKKSYVKTYKYELGKLNDEYQAELKKLQKHDALKSKVQLCLSCSDAAKKVMKEVMEEIRTEIEKKTNKQFFATLWKKDTYEKVKINSDYNISVLDLNGMESMGTLSAGERQLLALAFTEALHTVSGFDMPLLIDTPLGRISGVPKLNLVKELPNIQGEKQIILLMTDQEYTEEVREALKKNIGKEYKINFIETANGSKVEVKSL